MFGNGSNDPSSTKNYQKKKSQRKRPHKSSEEEVGDEDFGKLIGQYIASTKKLKLMGSKDFKQKFLETMDQLMLNRKEVNEGPMSRLSSILEIIEADLQVLCGNEKKLQQMAVAALKTVHQNINATKQHITALKRIQAKFKKQCEELLSEEKAASTKMADELQEFVEKLQLKLINDTKKKQLDILKKSLFQAMKEC